MITYDIAQKAIGGNVFFLYEHLDTELAKNIPHKKVVGYLKGIRNSSILVFSNGDDQLFSFRRIVELRSILKYYDEVENGDILHCGNGVEYMADTLTSVIGSKVSSVIKTKQECYENGNLIKLVTRRVE